MVTERLEAEAELGVAVASALISLVADMRVADFIGELPIQPTERVTDSLGTVLVWNLGEDAELKARALRLGGYVLNNWEEAYRLEVSAVVWREGSLE